MSGERTPFAPVIRDGETLVGLYAPRGQDPQGPHEQDEVYVVSLGSGYSSTATSVEHHFGDFIDDLRVWVVFFGPHKTVP